MQKKPGNMTNQNTAEDGGEISGFIQYFTGIQGPCADTLLRAWFPQV